MNIARVSIDRPIYIWILVLICLGGGWWGFSSLGRLEDPAFTIKTAVVVTQYAGSSAQEVAHEVSEPIESEIQKMSEVAEIRSTNQPGLSIISVDIKDHHDGEELPEIWTKLRHRVAEARLPSGASPPQVNDGYGDVYGLYYAVTTPGFTEREIHALATFLRLELLTVAGVADVSVEGLPEEVIFVEPDAALAANLNVPPSAIRSAVAQADSVRSGGSIQNSDGRVLIQRPVGRNSVDEIAGLLVGVNGRLVNIGDFASVYRARESHPNLLIRYNGQEAFTLGVAGLSTENIVDVGHRVDARLSALLKRFPVGAELHPIYQQHLVVEKASNDFLENLIMSLGIVVVVLTLFMGWRSAIVVGSTLLLTVLGTLFLMGVFSIEMERISLGALIIAMGMLVDNAIVVAEGMQIGMQRGKSSGDAAGDAVAKTQIPLLGATVIGIMAFAGIGLSPDATGEYLFSLFAVIVISLLLSWVLALTVTPLLGHYLFARRSEVSDAVYSHFLFRLYGGFLRFCLKIWWLIIPLLIGVTVASVMLFGNIRQQFFPDSNTPLLFIDYKLTQGASIHTTAHDLAVLEDFLSRQDDVVSHVTFAGQGASRFMLTYQPEGSNPSYGHMIVRTRTLDAISPLIASLDAFAWENLPHAEFISKRLAFGPGGGAPIEVRFSGPDPLVLRDLAEEAISKITTATQHIRNARIDWREMEQVLRPDYAFDRAQAVGITRDDVTEVLEYATEGIQVGVFREGERQIPIRMRAGQQNDAGLMDQLIYSGSINQLIPLEQVIDGLVFEGQNTLMMRRDRVFTITVGADIAVGKVASEVQNEIQEVIDRMSIPLGYRMEWGGEYESSRDAQMSLGAQLPISLLVMVLISVLLYNALRQPLIIWLLVPMSVNGVVLGLLGTGLPFTFTALLGLLSLSGMLVKNGIVLVEEINIVRHERPGWRLADVIVNASVSRLRPVILAAGTTILGMSPLLADAFFRSMAVTIMSGLLFASILTLVAAPVFYYAMFPRGPLHTPQAAETESSESQTRSLA